MICFVGRLQLVLCLVVSMANGLWAQEFRAPYPGTGRIPVTGNWRFHTSDDMAWASSTLDDSGWETITADTTWGAQTHPGHTGFAWYRRAFNIEGVTGPMSISMAPVDDIYELYWNGEHIGGRGIMPPHAKWNNSSKQEVIALPKAGPDGKLQGVLAIRVWKSPLTSDDPNTLGGMNGAPSVGDSKVLQDGLRLKGALRQQSSLIQILLASFLFVTGGLAVGMWVRERHTKLFLWLGLFLLAASGYGVLALTIYQRAATYEGSQAYIQTISATQDIAIWMMILTLFGLNRERLWRRITAIAIAVYLTSGIVDTSVLFFWARAGRAIQLTDGIATVIYSVVPLYVFLLLAVGLRRKREWSLIPLVLACSALELFTLVDGGLGQGKRFTHIDIVGTISKLAIHIGSDYVVNLRTQLTAVLLVVLIWTVVRQHLKERLQQEKVEAEVKSAREVQQVLVPEAVAPVAGFAISSLYWPAEEVGGDLFQVVPGKDGDVLVVLADVSGKGLKAAMTVSLMVGAVRTLAEYTADVVEILDGMNRRLLGRTDGGFATCIVLHVKANGDVTMGNAGHLSPFRNGEELPLEGTLPLGVSPDAEFAVSRFHLAEEDEVTLYTDGVLEAMRTDGEIFGFARAREMMRSRPSAQVVAETARSFGQKDDITIVKIVRVHAEDTRDRMLVNLQMAKADART